MKSVEITDWQEWAHMDQTKALLDELQNNIESARMSADTTSSLDPAEQGMVSAVRAGLIRGLSLGVDFINHKQKG
mgnify:FL=1